MFNNMINDINNIVVNLGNNIKEFLPWDFKYRIYMLAIALTVGVLIDRLFEINKKNKETTK